MVRDMIEQLVESQPDIDVVGSIDFNAALVRAVDSTAATIVVLADGKDQIGAACDELLLTRPHLTALAVVDHGREHFLCETRPHRSVLGPLSPEALIALLRRHGPSMELS